MKKQNVLANIGLFTVVLALLFSFTTTAQKLRKVTFSKNDYEIKEVADSKGESVIKITGKELINTGRPGEPQIPVKLVKLIIASNEDVERIDYKILNKTERQLIAKIGSIATELGSEAEKTKLFHDKIYNTDEVWPKEAVKVVGDGYFDGNNHIVTLAVSPIQYYPKSNKIDVINEIEYTIKTRSSNKKLDIPTRDPEYQGLYDNALAFLVDNKEEIPMYSVKSTPKGKEQSLKKTTTLAYGYPYVIITTSALAPSFDKFIKWKKRKGVNVGIFTVDEIYSACPNGDTISGINDNPGKIRQFLNRTHQQGTVYALIGGTAEVIPSRYGTRSHNQWTSSVTDDHKIPTNLYFSDFTGDWDVDGTDDSTDVDPAYYRWQSIMVNIPNNPFGTSRYGEPADEYLDGLKMWSGDNVDYDSEIFVGRLLCTTSDEILRWTDKVIRYEQNPGKGNTTYLTRSLMTEADNMQDNYHGSIQGDGEYIANQLPATFTNTIIKEMTSGTAYSTSPSGSSIISNMNSNRYGLWTWINHGTAVNIRVNSTGNNTTTDGREITGMDSWQFDNATETGNGLNSLTNTDFPMVVYAHSCLVAPLDNYDGAPDYDMGKNMAQCFTTEFNVGGPAFLGASRDIDGNVVVLNKNFVDALNNGNYNLGVLESLSKTSSQHGPSITHNLIGCPETSLWTATPSYFTNATITDNGSSITINSGISGSTIAVCNVNSGSDHVEKQVNCSSATFYTSIRPLYVTITKQNCIPYTAITGGTFGQTLTIDADETLYIQAGANLSFPSGTGIIVNGRLNAIGSSSNNATFTRSGSSGTWNGIQFNSGSSGNLDYCSIQNAGNGIYCYNSSPTIKHSTLDNNSSTGLYLNYYSSPVLVGNNFRFNGSYGIRCESYSSPNLTDNGYPGSNVIRNNGIGILTSYYSNPNLLGYMTYGNSVFDNTGFEISASSNCTINARKVFWGTYATLSATSGSTIDNADSIDDNPNDGRNMVAGNSSNPIPGVISLKVVADDLCQALDKQKDKKYDEAIPLFLELLKNNKDALLGKYALSKIEECFTQARKADYLDYSKKEVKPLLKENSEIYVEALELEAHQMVNAGLYKDAINNLQNILKKHNLNSEIDKHTLFTLGAFNSLYLGDKTNSDKYFGELIKKYPKDELVNQIEIIKGLGVVSGNASKNDGAVLPYGEAVSDSAVTEELFSNYPNPFNPTTKITFALKEKGRVGLKIYDILGKEVANLADGVYEAGKHVATFNGSNLASGIYFYRLTTPAATITKKMMLVK